jgi:hypothetical protein
VAAAKAIITPKPNHDFHQAKSFTLHKITSQKQPSKIGFKALENLRSISLSTGLHKNEWRAIYEG